MAIQTLLPQYYDSRNDLDSTTVINSSGNFVNHHMYVNDSTNNTFIKVSGNSVNEVTLGFGDILVNPERLIVNITASGEHPNNIRFITRQSATLYNNQGDIIGRGSGINTINSGGKSFKDMTSWMATSGRFDTYTFDIKPVYSGFNGVQLENTILEVGVQYQTGTTYETRYSKIELIASGTPITQDNCFLFIPGNVRFKNEVVPPSDSSSVINNVYENSIGIVRGNFPYSGFNLGYYAVNEGTGSVIYSSGVTASGVFRTFNTVTQNGKGWFNYHRNNQADIYEYAPLSQFVLDVNNNGVNQGENYLDFGNVLPNNNFTLWIRFLPSGDTRLINGGTGYKARNIVSSNDIKIDTLPGTDNLRVIVGNNTTILTDYSVAYENNSVQDLLLKYESPYLYFYRLGSGFQQINFDSATRLHSSGRLLVGAEVFSWWSGGFEPYSVDTNSFGLCEFGLANYAFSANQIQEFGNSIANHYDYINENLHPSADTSYLEFNLRNASGVNYQYVRATDFVTPTGMYNLNTCMVHNDNLVAPSSITLKVGITSNTTNPSGLEIGGRFIIDRAENEGYEYSWFNEPSDSTKYLQLYTKSLPSGYFQDYLTLSGYFIDQSLSGFYYDGPHRYVHARDITDPTALLYIKHQHANNYSADVKIHSVNTEYEGWFIPTTGDNSITLYTNGYPLIHNDIDLFIEGEETEDDIDLFIQGELPYSGDMTLFTLAGMEIKNSTLYTKGFIADSGNIPLYIQGQVEKDYMPLYLEMESTIDDNSFPLYTLASSGNLIQKAITLAMPAGMYDTINLYLHNEDINDSTDNIPLTLFGKLDGGINQITMYLANSGYSEDNQITLYLDTKPFIESDGELPLFINRLTSNDAHFMTMYMCNSGFSENNTLYVNGAYFENSGVSLFMPSSVTPVTKLTRLYTHGY